VTTTSDRPMDRYLGNPWSSLELAAHHRAAELLGEAEVERITRIALQGGRSWPAGPSHAAALTQLRTAVTSVLGRVLRRRTNSVKTESEA